jgi:RimJ/RimL family protein N-acetyltransferase
MSDPYNIRALGVGDLDAFREMRLRALREHTGFFGVHPDEAEASPDSYWEETLDGRGKQVFGLFDGDRMIGITAVFTDREDPSGETAVLAMSYINPAYRGRHLSRLLYQARIDWAKAQPQFKRIVVSHRADNESSRRANQAFGFVYTGSKEKQWPDGTVALDDCYEMRIR